MCYNLTFIERRQKKYEERYKELLPSDWSHQYKLFDGQPAYYFVSGFTHPELPIIKHDGIEFYSWGLIPQWIKDKKSADDIRNKTLNAVGETVFEKPSYRGSIKTKRALLPVNGFFEWRDFHEKKYPYFVKVKGDELFSLGIIYESWVDKNTGEIRKTFSIITTPANHLMEKIHNLKKRMPLIISRENEAQWIDEKLSVDQIKSLIKPFDEKKMDAYTISQTVNSARNNRNVPEILEEVRYAELVD